MKKDRHVIGTHVSHVDLDFTGEDALKLYAALKPIWDVLERKVLQAYELKKAEEIYSRRHPVPETEHDRNIIRQRRLESRPKPEDCKHLKGGPLRAFNKDYALLSHRFQDGHTEVKCMICGKQFDPNDPETQKMVDQSTNRLSSSEAIIRYKRVNEDGSDHIPQ